MCLKATIKKVLEKTQELVNVIKHQSLAAVVDIRNWFMSTFEVFEGFQLICDWCAANNEPTKSLYVASRYKNKLLDVYPTMMHSNG